MNCTECKKESEILYGEYWDCRTGYIIKKHEHICPACAAKRHGIRTLKEINEERKIKSSLTK